MTVQDISNKLFEWFESSDAFEIGRDIKKIVPISENEEETIVTIKIALEKLEEMNLLASKEYGDKKYYILEKHMDSFQQNVELGPWTAKFLSGEINDFCAMVQDNTDLCETASIQEKDVRNLVHIIGFYKQKLVEKEQIICSLNEGEALGSSLLENYNMGPMAEEKNPDDEDPPKNKKKK
tara:strand:- start:239 stop:778 length:540 start_codon:yes stop_codon:yes gene_type:complete